MVETDLRIHVAEGFYGRIASRSGLALHHHIDVVMGPLYYLIIRTNCLLLIVAIVWLNLFVKKCFIPYLKKKCPQWMPLNLVMMQAASEILIIMQICYFHSAIVGDTVIGEKSDTISNINFFIQTILHHSHWPVFQNFLYFFSIHSSGWVAD